MAVAKVSSHFCSDYLQNESLWFFSRIVANMFLPSASLLLRSILSYVNGRTCIFSEETSIAFGSKWTMASMRQKLTFRIPAFQNISNISIGEEEETLDFWSKLICVLSTTFSSVAFDSTWCYPGLVLVYSKSSNSILYAGLLQGNKTRYKFLWSRYKTKGMDEKMRLRWRKCNIISSAGFQ